MHNALCMYVFKTNYQLCTKELNLEVVHIQSHTGHLSHPPTSFTTHSHLILTKHPVSGKVVVEVTTPHQIQHETQHLCGLKGVV